MFIHTFYGSFILVAILGSNVAGASGASWITFSASGIAWNRFPIVPAIVQQATAGRKEWFLAAAVGVRVTYGDMYPHAGILFQERLWDSGSLRMVRDRHVKTQTLYVRKNKLRVVNLMPSCWEYASSFNKSQIIYTWFMLYVKVSILHLQLLLLPPFPCTLKNIRSNQTMARVVDNSSQDTFRNLDVLISYLYKMTHNLNQKNTHQSTFIRSCKLLKHITMTNS